MTQETAEAAVIEVIVEIQEMGGLEACGINAETKPIGDVPGFDSLNACEATVAVAARLRMDIPNEANIFINKAGDTALSVEEIAARIMEIAQSSEGATHGKRE
ncbi:MAG: hypothetical protein IH897_13490 [Planctomycetes bacterium]|nr:hypothetical protein [Planctomycetota bacterium]